MSSRTLYIAGLLGIVLVVGLAGCTTVRRQWSNFTAYYNTLHNAQNIFEREVENLTERSAPVDTDRYLTVFFTPTAAQATAFDPVIQKSADVLRDHPRSKWVDDALMLIGRSYFYQQNYVGAGRKFREVIQLGSPKQHKARFWLVRTLIAAEQYEEAATVIPTVLADMPAGNRWTAQVHLAQGRLLVQQRAWDRAAQALATGLRMGELPDEIAARGAFLLGQVNETRGEYAAAMAAYSRAVEENPTYELRFAARLSAARVMGSRAQRPREALRRVEELMEDDKNFEKRDDIRLVKGKVLQAAGQRDAARATYKALLHGPEAAGRGVAGRVHYALGTLYRDAYTNFVQAAAHFDTAATQLQTPATGRAERLFTSVAITDSRTLADRLGPVAQAAQHATRLDSLLRLGRMPRAAFRAYVDSLRRVRLAARDARAEAEANRASTSAFNRATYVEDRRPRGTNSVATAASSAGFLYHESPVRVQEGMQSFRQRWGDRPLVPNWRRAEAITTGDATAITAGAATDSAGAVDSSAAPRGPVQGAPGSSGASTGGRVVDVSAVPRTAEARAAMRKDRALARYALANALFLSANRPDSAAHWYREVLADPAAQAVAPRARYALAEALRAAGDTTEARALYRQVIANHPDTPLADQARQRLGQPPRATSDDAAQAAARYREGLKAWRSGRPRDALETLLAAARAYPQTPTAPRAWLAATTVYLRTARDTSRSARLDSVVQVYLPLDTTARVRRARPDSAVMDVSAMPDTSRGGAVDTLATRAPADTTVRAQPARRPALADTTTADTTAARAAVAADSSAAAPEDSPSAVATRMLQHLLAHYPATAQAKRAQTWLDVLRSPPAPAADTTAPPATRAAPSRSARAPSAAPADSTRGRMPARRADPRRGAIRAPADTTRPPQP